VACFSSSLRVAHEEVVGLGKACHTLVERSTHLIGRLLLLLLLLLLLQDTGNCKTRSSQVSVFVRWY
jgi:hypothetical protein